MTEVGEVGEIGITTVGEWRGQTDWKKELADAQVVTEACGLCGEILTVAPLQEARAAFRVHAETYHPHVVPLLDRKRMPKFVRPVRESDYALIRRLELIAGAAA